MQYSIKHLRERRLALWVVLAAAVFLLTAFVACAQAQAADATDAAAAVELVESTASAESAPVEVEEEPAAAEPAPAPDPAPQPVEAVTKAAAAEGALDATTQGTQPANPASTLAAGGSAPEAAADLSEVDRTPAQVTRASQAAVDVVASAGGHLPQPDRALPELSRKIQRDAANTVGQTENVVRSSLDRIDLSGMEDSLTVAVAPLEDQREALPLAAAPQWPHASAVLPRTSPAGSPDERAIPLGGPLGPHLLGLGGIRPLLLGEPRTPDSFGMGAAPHVDDHRSPSPIAGAYIGDTARGSREPTPIDTPVPPNDLPQMGASPSGATSFTPIAALLALLALVAPAIDRRRRKAVACSPPIPFVCVLERPG